MEEGEEKRKTGGGEREVRGGCGEKEEAEEAEGREEK